MAESSGERLRVWTLADVVGTIKYPLWTAWRFLVDFPLAVRNTIVVLDLFRRTAYIGYRVLRVLDRNAGRWSARTRGRYVWRVARRFWATWVLRRAGVDMAVVGTNRVDWAKPHIVVSNHQSTLDIFPLIAAIPFGRYVVKKEVLAFPYVGAACRRGAQVIVDRGDHEQSMRAIREGMREWPDCNLVFFAEGTRSRDGALGTFKKGAFAIAKETGLPVVPVAITGTWDALPKGSLLRLKRKSSIQIEFGRAIAAEGGVLELTDRTRGLIAGMIEGRHLHTG